LIFSSGQRHDEQNRNIDSLFSFSFIRSDRDDRSISSLPSAIRLFAQQWRAGLDTVQLNVVRHFGDSSAQSSTVASSSSALDVSSTLVFHSTIHIFNSNVLMMLHVSWMIIENELCLDWQGRTSTASQVLKQVLTQLLLYYQRFHDLVKKHCLMNSPAALAASVSLSPEATEALTAALRELVPFHTLMFEVKKFVNRS
jgi:hypothetical protein